ncbi:hypothetical protein RCL1_001114 [Eukaryota sp. TZLM3-RCL]
MRGFTIIILLLIVSFINATTISVAKEVNPNVINVAGSKTGTFTELCLSVHGFGSTKTTETKPVCTDPLQLVLLIEEHHSMKTYDPQRQRVVRSIEVLRALRENCDLVVIALFDTTVKSVSQPMQPSEAIKELEKVDARGPRSSSSLSAALNAAQIATSRYAIAVKRRSIIFFGTGMGTFSSHQLFFGWPFWTVALSGNWAQALRYIATMTSGRLYMYPDPAVSVWLKSDICVTSIIPPDHTKPTAPCDITVIDGLYKHWFNFQKFTRKPDSEKHIDAGTVFQWDDVGTDVVSGKKYLPQGKTVRICFKMESKLPGKCPVDLDLSRVEYMVNGQKKSIKFPQAYVEVKASDLVHCPSEREVLVQFFEMTGGKNWKQKTGWLEGPPCNPGKYPENKWFGVECSDGHVKALRLPENNLVGQLPASIGCLPFLQDLHLKSNKLSGALPSSIGKLKHLQYFDLSHNLLSGIETCDGIDKQSIPASVCELSFLKYFYISDNRLTGLIPECVYKLKELIQWHTDRNKLTGEIPKGFLDLPKLTELHTFCNKHNPECPPWTEELRARGVIVRCQEPCV